MRSRPKLGLALIVSVFLLNAGISRAGYFGQRAVSRHGHSSNSDGGVITNLHLNGTLTAPNAVITSTLTIGATQYALPLDYSSVLRGGWSIVASTRTYGATASTFTALNPNYIHEVLYRCGLKTAAGTIGVRFGDAAGGINTASKYSYRYQQDNSGAGNSSATSDADTLIKFYAMGVTAANNVYSWDSFKIIPDTSTYRAAIIGTQDANDKAPGGWNNQGGGHQGNYFGNGNNPINQFVLLNTLGKMDCIIYVLALVPPIDPP